MARTQSLEQSLLPPGVSISRKLNLEPNAWNKTQTLCHGTQESFFFLPKIHLFVYVKGKMMNTEKD